MTLAVPLDGRLTSQNVLAAPLDSSAVMYIVSPGTAAAGNSYQVSLTTLAAFFAAFPELNTELITAGATLASPYAVETTDTIILFKKTLASASYATCPLASTMMYKQTVLFKDAKGDADVNPITINFSGGELCDGLSNLTIGNPYGWVRATPLPSGGGWYQS